MVYHAQTDSDLSSKHSDEQTVQTIAAVATPPGRGGIGVIRVSGPRAEEIGSSIARAPLLDRRPALRKFFGSAGRLIDEGIVLLFRGPRSYTGEDVCEFHCHGSPVALNLLLESIVLCGARLAEPGEYTRRAFENGKLDLAQAEAVADLINSSTDAAARSAMRSLTGRLSHQVDSICSELVRIRAYVEASIDFPDDEIDLLSDSHLAESVELVRNALSLLQQRAGQGILLREGVSVAIAGMPNAGKSSLLNRFAGEDRVIVAPQPGTTRDTVEIIIDINGLEVRITDTAGMRAACDPVEAEGVKRAWAAIEDADLIVYVVDDDRGLVSQDRHNLDSLGNKRVVLAWNKIDLTKRSSLSQNYAETSQVLVSAKKGDGFDELCKTIARIAGADFGVDHVFLARRRHLESIRTALAAVETAQRMLLDFGAGELAAEDLRAAHDAMAAITGEFSTEELLGEIFSSFCIGK